MLRTTTVLLLLTAAPLAAQIQSRPTDPPIVTAVNGPAVAGGCGLALLCDFTLASAEAFFSFSEVKIGFVPALVGVYLERMAGAKAARDLPWRACCRPIWISKCHTHPRGRWERHY